MVVQGIWQRHVVINWFCQERGRLHYVWRQHKGANINDKVEDDITKLYPPKYEDIKYDDKESEKEDNK